MKNVDFSNEEMERYLSTLGSKVRIVILKFLIKQQFSVNFRDIEREVETKLNEKPNISHHLNSLLETSIIIKDEKGKYLLTHLGKELIKGIDVFKEILFQNSAIQIRTSNYTLEPFIDDKIINGLIKESEMSEELARDIAKEAKKRLIDSKVKYLTAPLIREYINAILIERGLEKYRHKLTRLGVPPFDIKNMIHSSRFNHPLELINRLGSNIMEQYTLLNNINQKYADLVLSGQFVFTDLEKFTQSPLELIISGKNFIEILNKICEEYLSFDENISKKSSSDNFADVFSQDLDFLCSLANYFIDLITPFFTEGLIIIRFDLFLEIFFEYFSQEDLKLFLHKVFSSKRQGTNFVQIGGTESKNLHIPISLEITTYTNFIHTDSLLEIYLEEFCREIENNNERFLEKENKGVEISNLSLLGLPRLQIHIDENFSKEIERCKTISRLKKRHFLPWLLISNHHVQFDFAKLRGHQNPGMMLSHLDIPISFSDGKDFFSGMILEKISINALILFEHVQKDKQAFLEGLEQAIQQVFTYFEKKFENLCSFLGYFSEWNKINKIVFSDDKIFTYNHAMDTYEGKHTIYCGISVHGIEEVIFLSSELCTKDTKNNRELLIEILDFVQSLISKQNDFLENNVKYVLCEPSAHKTLLEPLNNILHSVNQLNWEINSENDEASHKKNDFITPESIIRKFYHLRPYCSSTPIRMDHYYSIYKELSKSSFKGFSSFLLPTMQSFTKTSSNEIEDEGSLIKNFKNVFKDSLIKGGRLEKLFIITDQDKKNIENNLKETEKGKNINLIKGLLLSFSDFKRIFEEKTGIIGLINPLWFRNYGNGRFLGHYLSKKQMINKMGKNSTEALNYYQVSF